MPIVEQVLAVLACVASLSDRMFGLFFLDGGGGSVTVETGHDDGSLQIFGGDACLSPPVPLFVSLRHASKVNETLSVVYNSHKGVTGLPGQYLEQEGVAGRNGAEWR